MAHPPEADLGALLEALLEAGVEMIVVGGAAAVLPILLALLRQRDAGEE